MGMWILLPIVPLLPILMIEKAWNAVVLFFTSLSLILTGADSSTVKIELPYIPEQGIVWELQDFDDTYLNLKDTKVNEKKQTQTFKFESVENKDDLTNINDVELVFTDKNGNEKCYLIVIQTNSLMKKFVLKARSEDEYFSWEYTPAETVSTDEGVWKRERVNYVTPENYTNEDGKTAYRYLASKYVNALSPQPIEKDFNYYYFYDKSEETYEKLTVTFHFENDVVTVVKEEREYHYDDGVHDTPPTFNEATEPGDNTEPVPPENNVVPETPAA